MKQGSQKAKLLDTFLMEEEQPSPSFPYGLVIPLAIIWVGLISAWLLQGGIIIKPFETLLAVIATILAFVVNRRYSVVLVAVSFLLGIVRFLGFFPLAIYFSFAQLELIHLLALILTMYLNSTIFTPLKRVVFPDKVQLLSTRSTVLRLKKRYQDYDVSQLRSILTSASYSKAAKEAARELLNERGDGADN